VTDALRRQVVAEHELRRSLERELHEGPQQNLVALAVQLQLARQLVDGDRTELLRLLDESTRQVHAALEDVRRLTWRIYPSLLLDAGLVEALRAVAHLEAGAVGRRPADVEAAIYFCCVELVEAATTPATILLTDDERGLQFEVRAPELKLEPRVQDAVRDRIAAFGGDVTFSPRAARGVVTLAP
jgi:signal transduction histidine kinase